MLWFQLEQSGVRFTHDRRYCRGSLTFGRCPAPSTMRIPRSNNRREPSERGAAGIGDQSR